MGAYGCSSDPASSPAAGTGGTPGTGGGVAATGGAPGAGGGVTATGGTQGGTLGAADAKITGSITQCSGTQPIQLPSDIRVPVCTLPNCQQGACITKAQLSQYA